MRTEIPDNCREAPACIDYKSYIFSVPQELSSQAYEQLRKELIGLGRLRHEMLGVAYVDTEWGLLVVPQQGFPEMKISFFHHITRGGVGRVLRGIAELLNNA